MNYDQEILKFLTLAGDKGLKAEKIARHVFNACNSMFTPLDYKDVHAYVSQFLIKYAKDSTSVIEKGEGHGVYRLNLKSNKAQQLMLKFGAHEEDVQEEDALEAGSVTGELSLF